MKRYLKWITVVVGLLLSVILMGSQSAYADTYGGPGYFLIGPNVKGSPYDQHLWLDPHAYKANVLNDLLISWTAQMQSWGIDVTYVGYGTPPASVGEIAVTSSSTCDYNALGNTYDAFGRYSNGDNYITHADVNICTLAYTNGYLLTDTVAHELGHALGLGHFNTTYNGSYQVMRAGTTADGIPYTYQSGDRNGIGYIATQSWGLRHGAI